MPVDPRPRSQRYISPIMQSMMSSRSPYLPNGGVEQPGFWDKVGPSLVGAAGSAIIGWGIPKLGDLILGAFNQAPANETQASVVRAEQIGSTIDFWDDGPGNAYYGRGR